MDTFDEFKRRKIVQWSLAYLAGAWVALQLVAILGEQFGWPDSLERAITVLLVFGLFATLVLAWYHGEKGRQRVSGPELLMLAALFGLTGAAIQAVRDSPSEDAPTVDGDVSEPPLRVPTSGEGTAVRRASIVLPDSAPLAFVGAASLGIGRTALAISPDGSRLAYVAQQGETTQLFLRNLNRMEVHPLPGTDGAYQPFFSPDGKWVGFFSGRSLKKVSPRDGHVITLATVREPMGASWGQDGRILVAQEQGWQPSWVPGTGGVPRPTEWQPSDFRLQYPELLPGGRWILHGAVDRSLSITSLETGRRYVLTRSGALPRDSAFISDILYGMNPQYLESGHIAYISGEGILMVLPFDLERLRTLGPPVPIMKGIRIEAGEGGAQLTVSRGGTFVYAPGGNVRRSQFVWVDHASGDVDTLPLPADSYGAFDLSPAGERLLAVVEPPSGPSELWVFDVRTGDGAQVPSQDMVGPHPRWWPDGARVLYSEHGRSGKRRDGVVVLQSLNSLGSRDTIRPEMQFAEPTPDGRFIAVIRERSWLLLPIGQTDTSRSIRGDFAFPDFSPDGRWLAFTDYGTGTRSEVYLAPVNRLGEHVRVTPDGGEEAVWTPDGTSLVYRNGQQWMKVKVSLNGGVDIGRRRVLFEGPYLNVPGWSHDISADGGQQLLLLGPQEQTTNELVIVTNWLAEVQRAATARLPSKDESFR